MAVSIRQAFRRSGTVIGLVLALIATPGVALADSLESPTPRPSSFEQPTPPNPGTSSPHEDSHPTAPSTSLPTAPSTSGASSEDGAETQVPENPQSGSGWVGEGAQRRYIDPETGLAVTNKVRKIDGVVYAFNAEGFIVDGWFTSPEGEHYYSTPQGVRFGWFSLNSKWYYGDPAALGARVHGWLNEGGARYYLAPTGEMLTGWQNLDSDWYFFAASGAMRTGWLAQGSTWYYLSPSGAMATEWQAVGGYWYYLYSSGAMASGWLNDQGTWYYLNGSGAMYTGWLAQGSTWYYLSPSGAMATGWQAVGGNWYYLYSSGAMASGWLNDQGTWYYLNGSGAMYTGWLAQGSTWYYLKGSGAMATDWEGIGWKWNLFDHYSGAWITDRASFQYDWDRAKSLYSPTNYLILVDTSAVHCTGFYWRDGTWWPQHDWPCSVGAPSTPTITGTYSIGSRGHSFGNGFTAYWWTQIWGDYLFHSTLYYQGTLTPLDSRLGMHISHGCIRMRYEDAYWINHTIPSGTTVHLY